MATAVDGYGTEVTDDDPSHYFGQVSSIDVVKFTNGEDANDPIGPFIAEGDDVTWTYEVTNTGNTPISDVALTDDAGTADDTGDDFDPTFTGGDTDGDGLLDVDETWLYEATGTAAAGQYANVANVSGLTPGGETVLDNDPSHYFGVVSGIDIEKYTNGEDADDPDRPGDQGRRPGPVDLRGHQHRQPARSGLGGHRRHRGDGRLSRASSSSRTRAVTCFANGIAEEGQYENIGTVTATDVLGQPLTDEDPSHYLGIPPAIDLVKFTNGDDANLPTGPFIAAGRRRSPGPTR